MKRFNIKEGAWFIKSLWQDTSGVILPYVTVMLVVIVGISLLALDGARYMSLQTQMQAAADALALAGAAELNGKSGARTRATNAITNFVSNGLSGMGIGTPVQHSAPVFYSALPAANQLPTLGTVASDDASAHYVLVTVTPVTVPTIFPVAYLSPGQPNSFTAGAQAVAGMNQSICGIPPVYICNPWEGSGTSLTTALSTPAQIKKQLKLLNDGTNGPGHFGWLVPPDGNVGASNLKEWASTKNPKTCYSDTRVNLNTGAKQSALDAFNVRLDVPGAGADADHPPDTNVRKGYARKNANACNLDTSPPTTVATKLPQDTSFPTSYQGNGQWNCLSYWTTEHASAPPSGCDATGSGFSRYQIYQYEIDNNLLTDWSRGSGTAQQQYTNNPISKAGENGQPLCAGVGIAVPGRRVVPVAVINCTANSAEMGTGGQNADNIPVEGYAKFFISEPVDTTGPAAARNLFGEFTGELTSLEAKIFQNVKLYR